MYRSRYLGLVTEFQERTLAAMQRDMDALAADGGWYTLSPVNVATVVDISRELLAATSVDVLLRGVTAERYTRAKAWIDPRVENDE